MALMVHGFHVIFSTYGFWLPNDPRGSWSDWVRRWELVRFGKATKVDTRQSVARAEHDPRVRVEAKAALLYPEVQFSGREAQAVAIGFREAVAESGYLVHACSILPQHVHMVLGPHERRVQRIVGHLKGRASQRLKEDNLHPLAAFIQRDGTTPSLWGRNCWKVFLFTERDVIRAIQYVEDNPLKENTLRQRWSFVQPYAPDARSKLRR